MLCSIKRLTKIKIFTFIKIFFVTVYSFQTKVEPMINDLLDVLFWKEKAKVSYAFNLFI